MPQKNSSVPRSPMLRAAYLALTLLFTAAVLTVSTYAWFSQNRRVAGDTVTVRSGQSGIALEIAPAPNGTYGEVSTITPVAVPAELTPVSTANLTEFYTGRVRNGSVANKFTQTETGYYQGRVYLRAALSGAQAGTAGLLLYLDTAGILVNEEGDVAGLMRNAARVGLVFTPMGGTPAATYIFNLSAEHNPGSTGVGNTQLPDGSILTEYVLAKSGGNAAVVADPAVSPDAYTLIENPTTGAFSLPANSLLRLAPNTVYQVDIFYYIEGCDSDCDEAIQGTGMSIQLPLFGVLDTAAGGAA